MATNTLSVQTLETLGPETQLGSRSDQDLTDIEAYRQLYVSVIQLAIKDYEFLRRIAKQHQLTPSERKKLRGVTEDSDPVEFFASRWFEDICGMIGIHAQAVRERLNIQV